MLHSSWLSRAEVVLHIEMPSWGRALVATVALFAVGKVGEVLAPALLARDWPACLALLVLNANDLHLVLTVRSCGSAGRLLAWFCVCTSRRVSEDAFFYWLGRHHGPEVTALLGLDLALARRWLARASLCALVIVPGAPVCVVAALANVRWTHFIVADVLATAARAIGLYYTSSALTQPLDMLLAWSLEHSAVALLVTSGVACVTAWPLASRLMRERRVGRPPAVDRPQSGGMRWTYEMQDVPLGLNLPAGLHVSMQLGGSVPNKAKIPQKWQLVHYPRHGQGIWREKAVTRHMSGLQLRQSAASCFRCELEKVQLWLGDERVGDEQTAEGMDLFNRQKELSVQITASYHDLQQLDCDLD